MRRSPARICTSSWLATHSRKVEVFLLWYLVDAAICRSGDCLMTAVGGNLSLRWWVAHPSNSHDEANHFRLTT